MNKKIGILMFFVLLFGAVFLSACANQEAVGRNPAIREICEGEGCCGSGTEWNGEECGPDGVQEELGFGEEFIGGIEGEIYGEME